jgi:hypothetical protein
LKLALAALALFACHAAARNVPCDRWEYARLKDATRQELSKAYCSAERGAELNRKLAEISGQPADHDAHIVCLQAADDAQGMLVKKFKAKAPPLCK